MVVQLAMTVVVAAEGTVEKEKGERERERERERDDRKRRKTGEVAGFSPILDLIFSSLRPSNPPLWSGATSVYVPMSR